jgi:hypothetical protein
MNCWKAYHRGYEGVGFWSFNDSGTTSVWDDYDWVTDDYSVVYEGTNKPVTSVRWEAWRQGIQDYRLLDWVKELATTCPDKKLAASTNSLLQKAVTAVLTDVRPNVADQWVDQLRAITIKLLQVSGQISAINETETVPLCLTGNGGAQFINFDTGGFYSYDPALSPGEIYGERCGDLQGPIYFKGKNAKSGKQLGNKADGDLTDGLWGYPMDWCLYTSSADPSNVIFDLQKDYTLSHALLYSQVNATNSFKVYVRQNSNSKSWTPMTSGSLNLSHQRTYDGGIYIDLKKAKARYVKLEIGSRDVRLGEFKIFGW